jgi:hypothetical protein
MRFFALLRECDPTLGRWFLKGLTRDEALHQRVDLDAGTFAACLEESRVLQERWYLLAAWNGEADGDSSGLRVHCGSTAEGDIESVDLSHYPGGGPPSDRLLTHGTMTRVMRAIISAWEPETGVVTHTGFREAAFPNDPFEDRVGWINYYPGHRGVIPPLPPPVTTEPVGDQGTLVILCPERITASPEHIALARRVSAELKKAGILHP